MADFGAFLTQKGWSQNVLARSRPNYDDKEEYREKILKGSDLDMRFKSLEEEDTLKYSGHSAKGKIMMDGSIADRRSQNVPAHSRRNYDDKEEYHEKIVKGSDLEMRSQNVLAHSRPNYDDKEEYHEKTLKGSDLEMRLKSLEEEDTLKYSGRSTKGEIMMDGYISDRRSQNVLAHSRRNYDDKEEYHEKILKGSNFEMRLQNVLARTRPSYDDKEEYHEKTLKGSGLEMRFKSLEDEDTLKYVGRSAKVGTMMDVLISDRRCGCADAAFDRHYFDQPFACVHCHGSAIQSLPDYIEWNPTVEVYVPPGDAYDDIFLDTGIDMRVILRSATRSLHKVHQANKSFDGNFELCDLYVDKQKCVRFDSRKATTLRECTRKTKDADYNRYAQILSRDLFRGQVIPTDILKWIQLMELHPVKHQYLIVHNICLMESRQSVHHFGALYGHLEVLRKEKSRVYWRIINELTARHTSWEKDARKQNIYVKAIYDYKDPNGQGANFEHDARGLLRLVWNMIKHILPNSVVLLPDSKAQNGEEFKKLVPVRKFTDRMIESLIKSTFIGLMFDLQELLHRWGHLERFWLEEYMGKA